MKGSLFVTGSSGFIAGNFLQEIQPQDYKNIYCLSRSDSKVITSLSEHNNLKFIKGSIFDAHLYTSYLSSCDTVIHFAAATGKANPEEYFKVNAEGTKFLVKQCEELNVKKFLYISSISVKFADISQYYYAQSKKKGEDAVRNSSLNYTIVRPTIVIGKESLILKSLVKLAKSSVIPIFGNGQANIQPIYVNDLTDCLLYIIREGIFLNETYEIGGPDVISIEDFIKRIRQIFYNKKSRTVHIPLGLLIPILSFLEKIFYSYMPINIGQLSSFRYDGTIEENRIFHKHLSQMKNIDTMLRLARNNE